MQRDGLGKCTLQSLHVGTERVAVGFEREALRKQPPSFADGKCGFGEINSFDTTVKLLAQGNQQFMKSFLDRRIPAPHHPAFNHRVIFVIPLNVILLVGSAVIFAIGQ